MQNTLIEASNKNSCKCREQKGELIQIKDFLKNFLRYIPKKAVTACVFLKKTVVSLTQFLYRSRKTFLLVVAVALITLIFSFSIFSGFNTLIGEGDRSIPTTGTVKLQNLEIYSGDVKYDSTSGAVYVDWGELTLGASKNATFQVKSNSNVDVKLGLNVTNWAPKGIEDYLTISWDYNGTRLYPEEAIPVTVNLTVSASEEFIDFLVTNEVTAFGFDITIYASGV